jgi:CRP-like cAMP-binding protein
MITVLGPHVPSKNRLLAALPPEEYKRFARHLQLVQLAKGKIIYHAGDVVRHAYFPLDGMLSMLPIMEDGSTIEVAMVGNEGMIGIPSILRLNKIPYQVMVQMSTYAMRVNERSLREEFNRGGGMHDLLLNYIHDLLSQVAQSAVCSHYHKLTQRLCCLLLVGRGRVKSDTLHLTHELLAHMLGVSRTRVTMCAANLQKENLICYSRGKITILNKRGLEATACKCYWAITGGSDQFIAA